MQMYEEGLVYRGKRIVNWCSKHQTSLSDIETESIEEKSKLYYFKYGPFEIATARPETKFADKYVVMHPDDERYMLYKDGEKFTLEWINGPIEATVVKDPIIDMEFGTGVMTITPWHSQVDFELAKKHDLPIEQIIDWRGKLLPVAGEFEGMRISEAREKIVEKLENKGLVTRIDENYSHVTKHCYKCNTIIEPQVKDQWFVKMAPLAEMALAASDAGEFTIIPEHETKTFRHWLENVLDWNISRQIVWGIPIPAWFCDEDVTVVVAIGDTAPNCETCKKPMRKDPDTFDTWFSSGQWPLMTTGYPDGKDFGTYFPTDVLETGRDILFFWVTRMIFFSLYLTGKAPFKTVYLHGLVNDKNGKKMSKSKGNVINPLELTDKYGTDALRMGLVVGNTPGTDLALGEDKIKGYRNFANKLWNVARFVLENTQDLTSEQITSTELTKLDGLLIEEFNALATDITKDLEEYRVYMAAEKIYHYVWDKLAAEILESSKAIFTDGEDESMQQSRRVLLRALLMGSLKLLHPFMPFVTEEIWQSLPDTEGMLMIASWPAV
jgi:valyl-tRNA synthetase